LIRRASFNPVLNNSSDFDWALSGDKTAKMFPTSQFLRKGFTFIVSGSCDYWRQPYRDAGLGEFLERVKKFAHTLRAFR
jgi:hypothetical protein